MAGPLRAPSLLALALCLLLVASTPVRAETVVALGDSYSSGEGAPPFLKDRESAGCHRSAYAWPFVMARQLSWPDPQLLACSGATSEEMLHGNPADHQPNQLAELAGSNPDVVTLTIGGNDLGFKSILERCLVPGDRCDRHYTSGGPDRLEISLANLEARLPAVYGTIRGAAPRARLVVAGYPRLFPLDPRSKSCTTLGGISRPEQLYLNEKQRHLNAAIERAANAAGAAYVDVTDAVAGHEVACGGERWINGLHAPLHLEYSFHPNKRGHEHIGLIAQRLFAAAPEPPPATTFRRRMAALATRFRPYLFLDGTELWRPLDVDSMLAEGWHRVCSTPTERDCPTIAGAAALKREGVVSGGTRPFLRIDGLDGVDARLFRSLVQGCRRVECAPERIYYHASQDADYIYLDYWWYLRFNDSPGPTKYDHQSDWEGVVVAVDRRDLSTFAWVGFAEHDGIWRYLRATLSCDGVEVQGSCGTEDARFGHRVNVFVANGTHAAYPASCDPKSHAPIPYLGLSCRQVATRGPGILGFHVPEASFDGTAPWALNIRASALTPLGPWASWPGRWDPRDNVKSPADQGRFRDPRRASDTRCPPDACAYVPPHGFERACKGWFGLDAVATACDADVVASGASGAGLLRISRGVIDLTASLDPALETIQGQDVPGLAQLLGGPLLDREELVVSGTAGPDTELYVRASRADTLYEARFVDLGLESGGRAAVLWRSSDAGEAQLVLRHPDGSLALPRTLIPYRAS